MDDVTNLLHSAFDSYLNQMKSGGLEPSDHFLPYEFSMIDQCQWRPLGDLLVSGELQEVTNKLNNWHRLLLRWHAWNSVIVNYDMANAWELRQEFLEPLAHQCLLEPSAIRDTFTFVITNSMHQVRLITSKNYPDFLEGDPTDPKVSPKPLTRRKKENRLAQLISMWPESKRLMTSLQKINDRAYQRETSDYRNLASHSITPHLGIGITQAVVRSVEQATELVERAAGTFISIPIPGKMSVSYSYGGTASLDMENARLGNLVQYRRSRVCYHDYLCLLSAAIASMPPKKNSEQR